jgi:hypothetical protein
VALNFGVNITMVSDIVTTWAVLLDRVLSTIFPNPTKSQLLKNYPERLVAGFDHAKICMLLDCCDVECEQPAFRRVLASLYSTYHHQAGIKYAVGCTAYGAVPAPWCPDGYPSSVSDVKITALTGIIADNLRDGDACEARRPSFPSSPCHSPLALSLLPVRADEVCVNSVLTLTMYI